MQCSTILYLRSTEPARSGIVEHARHFRRSLELLPAGRVIDFLPHGVREEIDSRQARRAVRQWVRDHACAYRDEGRGVVAHAEIGNAMHREFWAGLYLQEALPHARFFATIHDPPKLTSNPYRYVRTEYAGLTPLRLVNMALTRSAEEAVAWARRRVEEQFVRRCEGLFALSAGGCLALRESQLFAGKQVFETRLAIPTSEVSAGIQGDSDDSIRIVFFGFISPNRGIEELIDAFAALCACLERRDAPHRPRLLIFGGLSHGARGLDAWLDSVRRRVAQSGFAERIAFLPGFVDEAERERRMTRADIVVLPYKEAAGVRFSSGSAAWALARGKAVVAARSNTLEEAIRHEETGLLYDGASPDGLVEALDRVVCDDALRRRLGRQALEWIRREHSAERIARDVAQGYGLEMQ